MTLASGIKNAIMGDVLQHSDFTLNMFPPEEGTQETRRASFLCERIALCLWLCAAIQELDALAEACAVGVTR